MKRFTKLILSTLLLSSSVFAADTAIDLPSSVPIEVYKMKEDQIGIGYIQFNVKLALEDDYYNDKIGDVEYDTKGLIITLPRDTDTIIGNMFELSYTLGMIDSKLNDNSFVDSGSLYHNTYDKSGFYVGIRPSFNVDIYKSDMFEIKNSTAIHAMIYTLSGDFSVYNVTKNYAYAYDETAVGLGLKPSTVLSATIYPVSSFGVTVFGGLSTFIALDVTSYSNQADSYDEDTEANIYTSNIDPIYGFDLIYRGIFGKYDSFNLSSVIAQKETDSSFETIVRYTFSF